MKPKGHVEKVRAFEERAVLAGNLCRYAGYAKIVEAVLAAAEVGE